MTRKQRSVRDSTYYVWYRAEQKYGKRIVKSAKSGNTKACNLLLRKARADRRHALVKLIAWYIPKL